MTTVQMNKDRRAADNSTLAQVGVQWLIEHYTSYQHLCLVDSLSLRNPHKHQSAKRYLKAAINAEYDVIRKRRKII